MKKPNKTHPEKPKENRPRKNLGNLLDQNRCRKKAIWAGPLRKGSGRLWALRTKYTVSGALSPK